MKTILFAFFLLLISGCHLKVVNPVHVPQDPNDSFVAPLDLTVIEDANDGERLHIKGNVHALTDWPKENVIVHLVAVKGEEKVGEAYYPLMQPEESDTLNADETIPFSISASAIGATDYRLELLWGDEAKAFKASNAPAKQVEATPLRQSDLALIVKSMHSEYKAESSCKDRTNCPGTFLVKGVLDNQGVTKVSEVTLSIGLLDKSSREELSEDKIRIESLELAGGGNRDVKFDISIPAGVNPLRLEPFVRVIDFKAK